MKLGDWVRDVIRCADRRRARVVVVVLPRNKASVAFRTAANLDPAGRTEVGPGKLLFPRPHYLNWFADGFGQPRSLNSTLAAVFTSVPAAHVGHDHSNLRSGNAKDLSQFVAHPKRALRA